MEGVGYRDYYSRRYDSVYTTMFMTCSLDLMNTPLPPYPRLHAEAVVHIDPVAVISPFYPILFLHCPLNRPLTSPPSTQKLR